MITIKRFMQNILLIENSVNGLISHYNWVNYVFLIFVYLNTRKLNQTK